MISDNKNISFNSNMVSAVPTAGAVENLHKNYKIKLLNSLSKLIIYASQELNVDYSDLLKKFKFAENDFPRYLNSLLYYKYFMLLEAMKQQDIDEVKKIVSSLDKLDTNELYENHLTIEPGLKNAWEHQIFNSESKLSLGNLPTKVTTPTIDCFSRFEQKIWDALDLIAKIDPVFYKEIKSLVSNIKVIESKDIVGSTSPKFFGTMYIALPQGLLSDHPILHFIEHIVHETSHLFLNTVISYDKLVLNDPFAVFSAPIRTDQRPMLGIYHATFVLSRMVRIFKKLNISRLYPHNETINDCINDFTNKFLNGCNTIREHAQLTELGQFIFESTKECALIN